MRKLVKETLEDFISEKEDSPLGLAVLGTPAGGKSFVMDKIAKKVEDSRIKKTVETGENLTIDKLREEFQSKDPVQQLKGFAKAFYFMKKRAKEDPNEFKHWYEEIHNLWKDKISKLITRFKITIEDNNLYFNGHHALKNQKFLNNKIEAKNVIRELHNYTDYKRVVRFFQEYKQEKAIDKKIGISYDESGDEPNKMLRALSKLHKSGYVTDVFLIHPENVASNIIQNYYRVVIGGDYGRDSSRAIVQAYLDIEKNKDIYKQNSEDTMTVKSKELLKTPIPKEIQEPLKYANVPDDEERGDKPIDIFMEVQPMDPKTAYMTFGKKLKDDKRKVWKALLRYASFYLKGLPEDAKQALLNLTNDLSNKEALKILIDAANSKKYIFKYGGVTPELVNNAKAILK